MTAGPLLMGIDIGTSGSKGVLVTPSGDVVAECTTEHGLDIPRPGWAEHDADTVWWHDLCSISQKLLQQVPFARDRVAAVGCSAIGPTMLPLDADGRPLRTSILYGIDTRAHREIDELNERLGVEAIFKRTGQFLTSQSVGPKILWFKKNQPELYKRTSHIVTATTYLVYRLTGELVVDTHQAPYFGPLFDVQRMEWDPESASAICPVSWLPRVAWATEKAGTLSAQAASATGLPAGTPVAVGTVDAAAEGVSVGAVNVGDTMVMYGTTLFLIQTLDSFRHHRGLWSSVHCLPNKAALAAGMATSAALTRWFRDEFGQVERDVESTLGLSAYQLLAEQAAGVPPGSGGLVALPYFSGERTPIHDPKARGVIAGLTLKHGRAHIYRSLLEGTAYSLRHNIEAMAEAGALPHRLIAVGGGTKNPLWLQICSDVTGLSQEVPQRTTGASYGDAYFAGLAAGIFENLDPLRQRWVKVSHTVHPDEGKKRIYETLYGVYRRLYDKTKEEMHTLAEL